MNLGQGLLGAAEGFVKGMEPILKISMEEELDRLKEQRDIRAEQRKAELHIAQRRGDADFADKRRLAQAGEVERSAGLLAGNRVIEDKDAVTKADAEAIRINDMLTKKKITQAQADAAYRNIEQWKDEFSSKNTEITQDDRTQAAIQSGIISPEKAEDIAYKKERNAVTDRHTEAQSDVANRREDRLFEFDKYKTSILNKADERSATRDQLNADKEARAATAKALDGVNADIKSIEKELADPMIDPSKKSVIERHLALSRREAKAYRDALSSKGIQSDSTNQAPNPNRKPLSELLGGGVAKPAPPQEKKASVPIAESPAAEVSKQSEAPISGSTQMSKPVIRETRPTRGGPQYFISEMGSRGGGKWISAAEAKRLGLIN